MNQAAALAQTFFAQNASAIFAGLSGIAAALSYFATRSATRNSFRMEWTRDVIQWGMRVTAALAEAHSLCAAKSDAEAAVLTPRGRVMTDISALIDQGRFFFENRKHAGHGADKPLAYRGHRPVMLDHLVAAHDCLRDTAIPNPEKERIERLWGLRREFVSELQRIIEPRWLSRHANYNRAANA